MFGLLLNFCLFAYVLAQQNPAYDIVVAADGSGNFTTIQAAVNSTNSVNATIYIKKGIYQEKLVIPVEKSGIHFIGEDLVGSVITNGDYTGKPIPGSENATYGTSTSYTVWVQSPDVRFENLTIENSAGRVGQAVALLVDGDRFIANNCRLLGNQDTLYAKDKASRQYYSDCYIEGTTDYIFGNSTVIFDNCVIHSKMNRSFITAASTTLEQQYGLVFRRCNLTAEANVTSMYLGRPWRPYAATIFANSWLGAHILPAGWSIWSGNNNHETARYAEYNNTGPGAGTAGRVSWSRQLNDTEAAELVPSVIFGANSIFGTDWDPTTPAA
uniref:Pectinesterase n=1 Tax=Pratylenchus penetrans TaxID=45929 RepID=A0A482EUZ5_PRAPE|nr:pectin methylesterase [Pratylenchus penetrans]